MEVDKKIPSFPSPVNLLAAFGKPLSLPDGEPYGYQATLGDGEEADRPPEKDLGLPARSRFGEGRAEPLIELIRTN
jgi:hypothetical protein